MRTNLLNGLSNVVKKGAGLACSWSQVGRMSGEGAIEHPLSTHSSPFGTSRRSAGDKATTSFGIQRLAAVYGGKSKTRRDDHAGLHSYERLNACKPASIHPTSVCMAHGLENRTTALQKCGCATLTKNVKNSYAAKSFLRLAAMVTLLLTLACGQMWGDDRGFWDSGAGSVRFYRNGSSEYWANVNKNGVSDFSLGNIDSDGGLIWTDAWAKVWGGNDIFNSITLYWRVKGQDAGSGPSYSNYNLNWNKNLDGNNQYWEVTMQSQTCSTTGLAAGNYEVEFYWTGAGKDGKTYYLSNNGGNYHANFTLRRKITYHDTGKTSGDAPATEWFSGAATVRDNTGLLQKTGYVFAGWATSAERAAAGTIDHEPGESNMSVTLTADLDLYPVWKPGSYFISLTGFSTNGVKNTTDFISSNSLTNTATEVNGVTFSKSYYKTSNSQTSIKAQYQNANRFLVYDTKSTTTKIRVYVKNTDTSSKNLYYYLAKEGSTSETDQTVTLTAGEAKVININASNSKGTRFILSNGQYDKIFITQIIAIESGTTLPLPGQAGYELAFPGRVASHFLNINGIEIAPHNTLKWNYGDELRLQSGSGKYVKFTTTAATQLQVKIQKNKGFYVCTDKSNPSTTGFLTECSSAGTKNIYLDAAGTYYIMGETSSNTQIDKISFAAHTACTAPTGLAAGSTTYNGTTFTVTDGTNANNYEFYVSTSSTAPTASSTPTYTSTSKTLAVDDLNKNTTYYAWVRTNGGYFHKSAWTALTGTTFKTLNAYDITYNCDGATYGCPEDGAGLALPSPLPSAPFKAGYNFDGWFTNSGKTVEAVAGDELSDDVTLYAKWTKVYASTKDFTTSATQGTVPNQKTITTSYASYTPFRVDNFFFGATNKLCFESGNASEQYNGWKFQYSGSTIKFFVENDCSVAVAMGANAGCSIKYTPIDGSETTEALSTTANTTTTKDVKGGTMVTLTTTNGSTVTLKSITITDKAACTTPTIAWSTSPTNGNVGGNMTISVTSNYPTGVTITSNNSNATLTGRAVDGSTVSYTLNYAVAGNANITASVDGDGSTVCDETVNLDAVAITISKNTPTSYTVSGGGTLCSGGDADITLSGSQSGISYQLYNGASTVGDAVSGTGSALTWADQDDAGTYTVKAVANDAYNAATMSGSATIAFYDDISIGTQPTASVAATVSSAASLSGLALSSGSFNNAAYQWQTCDKDDASGTNTDITSGSAYANYNTATLSFTPSSAGTYYFRCVVSDDCGNEEASNVVTVTAKNQPVQYTVSGNASICSGDDTNITLSDSEDGVTYKLYKGGVDQSDDKVGDGDELTWTVSAAGTYTIKAAESSTYWERAMSGSATVSFKTATSISTQPATAVDATVNEDFTLGSALVAAGDGTLQYQWFSYSNAAGDADETSVRSASTTKTFTTSQASAGTYYYRVKVIGGCGTVASDVIAVTVAACSPTTLASMTITGTSTATATVGTAAVSLGEKDKSDGYKLGSNGHYARVTISSGYLQQGDVLSVQVTTKPDGNKLYIYKYVSETWTQLGEVAASSAGSYTYTLTAENVTSDFDCIGLYRTGGNQNPFVKSMTVTRPCASTGYTISTSATNGTIAVTDDEDNEITSAEEGDEVTITATPSNGYSFTSWSVEEDESGDPVSVTSFTTNPTTFTMPAADVTVSATFTPNTYDITYHLNGASWAGAYSAPATYTVGTGATLPISSNMTNTGYTFDGWYDNSGLTGSSVTAISTSDYGNKEYWAKWTENTYTITYNANGGSGSTTATEGHYVTVADNGFTAPDGKTFVEWNTLSTGSGVSYAEGDEIELTADMTLYAIWSKSVGTINWTVTKIDSKLYRGGGGYTITAEINDASWDATAADSSKLELTASEGVVLRNIVKSINGSSKAQITAKFDITTDVNANATKITFTLSVPENNGYAPKSDDHDESLTNCTGGKVEVRFTSSNKNDEGDDFDDLTSGDTQMIGNGIAKMIATGDCKISATTNKDGYRSDRCAIVFKFTGTTTLDIYYSAGSSSRSFALYSFSSGKDLEEVETSDYSTKSAVESVTGAKASFAHTSVTSSNPSISSEVVTTSGSGGGIKATYSSLSSGYYVLLAVSGEGYFYGFDADGGGGGGGAVTPTLTWDDGDLDIASDGVAKETGDADFTFTASTTSNTLGAITYASSNTSVVTVNATTGKVHVVGAGSATITATLAESGCYEEATATYNITVTDNCDDVAGTIGTEDLGCDGIRMTVTGHTGEGAGATYQWYKDGATIGGATSATYTATEPGEYYVEVTNDGEGHCTKASTNTVTLEASESATASKIVNQWYVKNGRRTPDVALVQTTNATGFYVKIGDDKIWDEANDVTTGFGGCPFRLGDDGIIYLNGQTSAGAAPSGLTKGDVTLKITATACGGNSSELSIVIHKQAATTAKSVAFVVDGTKGGEITAFTAAHATTSPLYVYLDSVGTAASARQFSLTGRNAYWSTVDSTLKAHYSQFDVILITDDPSTQTVPDGVSGKDAYKTKGYINALGALIDIRPILTMEAFVSALANWKSKGINGNPTSPNPRQYAMKLDCKDHEIFNGLEEGANVVATVEDGTTYWTVTMVDKAKSPYAGKSDTEDTDGTPALQGFSASDVSSLLLLGEISDGAYYAGVERQEEPAARLMLLGLNAKALPNALTEEGKIIIENALTYLLKTNMEEVDDCSNYFTGATSTDWNTSTNWSKGVVPNSPMVRARILKPCEISGVTAKAAQVDIVTGGTSSKFKGGSGTCTGKLTINPTGALVVGGEIRTAEAPYYNKADLMPTDTNNLVINTNATNQAALVFNNDKGDTKATVNLYSLGRTESSAYQFQYFAVPMTYLDVNPAFAGAGIYTYVWTEASGWERRGYYTGLGAFEGVGITTKYAEDYREYQMKGTLASTETKEIALTNDGNGKNMIGNSWTAPIQISELDEDNTASEITKTVYIYCAGNGNTVIDGTTETPGQWLAIPFSAAGFSEWGGLKVIPAMQAFTILTSGTSTFTLDYDKVVRGGSTDLNAKLRAPKRNASHEGIDLIRIRVADSQTHTDLYLFEGESFSEEFDNGWEAKYMSSDGRSAKLYAETAIGPMAVVAQPEYEGTVLGFAPGKETEYTFTFSGPNKEYYLNDLKEKKSTLISEEESYMFTFEEGDTNRFYISKTPINAPSVATGTDNTGDGALARKVIYNNLVYIIRAGKVYGIDGTLVVPNMEQK